MRTAAQSSMEKSGEGGHSRERHGILHLTAKDRNDLYPPSGLRLGGRITG